MTDSYIPVSIPKENKDEDGNITIKCNKHYATDRYNCYNRVTSLCPLKALNKIGDIDCYNGVVKLNWLDYIKFNNYMVQEFKKD